MNIEDLEILKELSEQTYFGDLPFLYYADLIGKLLTAYEQKCNYIKENEIYKKNLFNSYEEKCKELEKEKEKNNKIDEFCRKELAFERRLQRENREPDEFNQGRFYVSENIRKIIEEE